MKVSELNSNYSHIKSNKYTNLIITCATSSCGIFIIASRFLRASYILTSSEYVFTNLTLGRYIPNALANIEGAIIEITQ